MMAPGTDTLWIYKPDGTIQCEPDKREIPLEEMRAQLETLIGANNVREMEKRSRIMPALCGTPTGRSNAYRVTRDGWDLLRRGFPGNPGFEPWTNEQGGDSSGDAAGGHPTRIDELVGRALRVYKTGEGITQDLRQDRVNIEVSAERRIVSVWFG